MRLPNSRSAPRVEGSPNRLKHSLRRERFVKKTFLNDVQKVIPPKDLLGVYLVGSAQESRRSATALSDVDVLLVVPESKLSEYLGMKKGFTRLNAYRAKAYLHGIPKVNIHLRSPTTFLEGRKSNLESAQLIFGQDYRENRDNRGERRA